MSQSEEKPFRCWRVFDQYCSQYEPGSVLVFASSRGQAKKLAMTCEWFQFAEFLDLCAIRGKEADKYCKGEAELLDGSSERSQRIMWTLGWYQIDYSPLESCEECGRYEWEKVPESSLLDKEQSGFICMECDRAKTGSTMIACIQGEWLKKGEFASPTFLLMDQDRLLNFTYYRLGWTRHDDNQNLIIDDRNRFPKTAMILFIDQVVDEYNDLVPRKKIHRIESVTDGVPNFFQLPTEADHVLAVYWQTDTEIGVSPDIPEIIYSNQYQYSNDLLETLLNTNSIDEINQYNRVHGVDYQFVNGNTIQVLQRASINKIYVLYNYPRNLADISDKAVHKFAARLASIAIDAFISGHERTAGISRSGGLKEYDGGAVYETKRDKFQKEWDDWIAAQSKMAFIGLNDSLVKPTG